MEKTIEHEMDSGSVCASFRYVVLCLCVLNFRVGDV